MKIEWERLIGAAVPPVNSFAHQRVRELSNVIAARDRQHAETEIESCIRELPNMLVTRMFQVRNTPISVGRSVGHEGRVVRVALVCEHIEYPVVLAELQLLSRAIALDLLARGRLDHAARAANVFAKLLV